MLTPEGRPGEPAEVGPAGRAEARQRWRLVVARGAAAGTLTQRDLERSWEDALRRSSLPYAVANPGRDVPRLAFAAPLPVNVLAEAELIDVFLAERLRISVVRAALTPVVPAGQTLVDLSDVWLGEQGLPSLVRASVYRVELDAGGASETVRTAVESAVSDLMASLRVERVRRKGDRARSYDLRPLIEDLVVEADDGGGSAGGDAGASAGGDAGASAGGGATAGTSGVPASAIMRMRLRHDPDVGIGRADEVLAALAELMARRGDPAPSVRTVVRERLVLAGE